MTRNEVLYKCGWSPLEGRTLCSQVRATWVNGERVFDAGTVSGPPGGMRLGFAA